MRHRRWAAALAVGQDRKAPSEFRIWQAGENMTDFGPSVFSERSAREVMGEYERRGNKLSFDYEHLSVPENRQTDEPWEGAGYFEIEVRRSAAGPELWAVRIEWADEARRQIEQGERRYFSPDYYQDEKTGEIIRLNKIALCTDPATHRLNLLASVRGGKKRTTMDEEIENGEGAPESGDQKSKLMALLLAMRDKVEDEATKSQIDEAIILLAKGDDAPAMPAAAAEPDEMPPGQMPGQARAARAARPMAATARGESDPLARRLANLERRLDSEACTRLVEANRDLIPETSPALELWAIKQSPANLAGWVRAQRATRPKPAPSGGHQVQQRKQASTTAPETEAAEFNPESIQLTSVDRQMLKRTGGDPKQYLTHKRQLAARKAGVDWEPPAKTN